MKRIILFFFIAVAMPAIKSTHAFAQGEISTVRTIVDACTKLAILTLKGKLWIFNGIPIPGIKWSRIDGEGSLTIGLC